MLTQSQAQVLSLSEAAWTERLQAAPHDVYHTSAYHSIPGFGRRGDAFLFTYREQDHSFLWPYLLSPIRDGLNDVGSVYGYSGPAATGGADFLARAWESLVDHWKQQNVVSAFTRFHPVLQNQDLLVEIPDAARGIRSSGTTVLIDTSLPEEEQVRGYQKVLRQQIRKGKEQGLVTEEDTEWRHIDDFVEFYTETMARRNSRAEYLIDAEWVHNFRRTLGSHARLFVTKKDGQPAAALLAMVYKPYVHAHLTGISAAMAAHSPLKNLLDGIREWAGKEGYGSFHLGGGLGGKEDSLFDFKRKFSPLTHAFQTGAWVIQPEAYADLESQHRQQLAAQGQEIANPNFFPIYRYQP
jgi:hypothetical protein